MGRPLSRGAPFSAGAHTFVGRAAGTSCFYRPGVSLEAGRPPSSWLSLSSLISGAGSCVGVVPARYDKRRSWRSFHSPGWAYSSGILWAARYYYLWRVLLGSPLGYSTPRWLPWGASTETAQRGSTSPPRGPRRGSLLEGLLSSRPRGSRGPEDSGCGVHRYRRAPGAHWEVSKPLERAPMLGCPPGTPPGVITEGARKWAPKVGPPEEGPQRGGGP